MPERRKGVIIAVDFDDTLQIAGKPNLPLFQSLIAQQRQGCAIILNTCRQGKRLDEAVVFCIKNGLRFNAINSNIPQIVKRFGYDPRKIYADVYIDDKAIKP